MRSQNPADICFSLVCTECDAGLNVADYAQAMAEGWSEIDYVPNLPMANFVGLCPNCREGIEHWPGH